MTLIQQDLESSSEQQSLKKDVLVEVQNIKKHFPIKGGVFKRTIGHLKAVDGISFTIQKGETLGVVGE